MSQRPLTSETFYYDTFPDETGKRENGKTLQHHHASFFIQGFNLTILLEFTRFFCQMVCQ